MSHLNRELWWAYNERQRPADQPFSIMWQIREWNKIPLKDFLTNSAFFHVMRRNIFLKISWSYKLINCQSCHHIDTSQLISRPNQLTGFYMMATMAFNELNWLFWYVWKTLHYQFCKTWGLKVFRGSGFKASE